MTNNNVLARVGNFDSSELLNIDIPSLDSICSVNVSEDFWGRDPFIFTFMDHFTSDKVIYGNWGEEKHTFHDIFIYDLKTKRKEVFVTENQKISADKVFITDDCRVFTAGKYTGDICIFNGKGVLMEKTKFTHFFAHYEGGAYLEIYQLSNSSLRSQIVINNMRSSDYGYDDISNLRSFDVDFLQQPIFATCLLKKCKIYDSRSMECVLKIKSSKFDDYSINRKYRFDWMRMNPYRGTILVMRNKTMIRNHVDCELVQFDIRKPNQPTTNLNQAAVTELASYSSLFVLDNGDIFLRNQNELSILDGTSLEVKKKRKIEDYTSIHIPEDDGLAQQAKKSLPVLKICYSLDHKGKRPVQGGMELALKDRNERINFLCSGLCDDFLFAKKNEFVVIISLKKNEKCLEMFKILLYS